MLRTITVKGVGRVSMRPDLVVLSMKVTAKHMEYDQAMALTAQQLSQIKECIVSLGFEQETVKTTNFDVSADYDSCEDRHGNYQRVFKGCLLYTSEHGAGHQDERPADELLPSIGIARAGEPGRRAAEDVHPVVHAVEHHHVQHGKAAQGVQHGEPPPGRVLRAAAHRSAVTAMAP